MKAKVALNLTYLKPREQLAKFQAAINKCTGNTAIGTTNPTLTNCQSSLDAAKGVLDNIDAEELKLTNLRVQRDQSLEMAMSAYGLLGSFVENKSNGDPAVITSAGFDVAGTRTPAPPVEQVLNLVLTAGDHDGAVDASWNRDRSARSYEVQTSPDPMSAVSWVANQVAVRSSCTINSQTSGSKLWVRVRAIGADGPGLWSDPAMITVA